MKEISNDNKGYSLVELIIVIAIIAVLTGTLIFSISMIFSANARTCANDIKSALAETKITSMGKSEAFVEIYRDANNGCIYSRQFMKKEDGSWYGKDPEKIGNARVYVAYCVDGGSETELAEGDAIYLAYERSSGSFMSTSTMQKSDGTSAAIAYYSKIHVMGGNKDLQVSLIKLTGKVSVEPYTP